MCLSEEVPAKLKMERLKMATKTKRSNNNRHKQFVQPNILGNTRIPPNVRDALVHPDSTPFQEIPKVNDVEVTLSKVENLLGKGHYGAALRELEALKPGNVPLASEYEFIRQDKRARANLGIADRYFIRGDAANARKFYLQAIEDASNDPMVKDIAETASKVFDTLMQRRTALIQDLRESASTNEFDSWCGKKRDLFDFNVLDDARTQKRVVPDFYLERVFGERPPIVFPPGYIDPLPLETDFVDLVSSLPGSVFRTTAPTVHAENQPAADQRLRASVAMPLVANVMQAKLGLFALDSGLSVTGQARGTVPLFRYEYLRERAKQTIAHIQQIESRMLPIQFELDDFAEVVDAIRRPLTEQAAELEAVNQRINELVVQLAALAQAKKAVNDMMTALAPIQDECDCDWWCWITAVVIGVVTVSITAILFAGAIAAGIGGSPVVAVILAGLSGFFLVEGIAEIRETITCEEVDTILDRLITAQGGLQQSISENRAELNHALVTRDILITKINALNEQLSEVYQSNAARVLDARTLDLIQAQYNSIRQSLLTRAQGVAALAQDAFNFERDTELRLIRDAYFDQDKKDYTAAETLLRDLDGLDYVDITGRTQKAMQLSQTISLRKHCPLSFMALRLMGSARFTTTLAEFDRWFPGTHQQRIKEIRVEVLIDGQPVPVRGYLSNDGVSMVRFQDTGNKRQIDDVHVFSEPDEDIAKLCYKRLQRRRHVDTMAFPNFNSYLHEDRMRKLQDKERNFFENIGLESTWVIEFLPDQPVDLSKLTDVLVLFQYEARFDENLKRILEQKRYTGRREMSAIPIKRTLAQEGKTVDFSEMVSFRVPVHHLEAPALERKIVNVGFLVKPTEQPKLDGSAELDVSYDGSMPAEVATNESGTLATSTDHPAGTGLAALEAMAHGKGIEKMWTVKITALPDGLSTDAVDEIFLLVNYEYVP